MRYVKFVSLPKYRRKIEQKHSSRGSFEYPNVFFFLYVEKSNKNCNQKENALIQWDIRSECEPHLLDLYLFFFFIVHNDFASVFFNILNSWSSANFPCASFVCSLFAVVEGISTVCWECSLSIFMLPPFFLFSMAVAVFLAHCNIHICFYIMFAGVVYFDNVVLCETYWTV